VARNYIPAEIERRIDKALAEVRSELVVACMKHGPLRSPHEGYAVILEELDELWDEVRADRGHAIPARIEAKQVAAMALRYIVDLSDGVEYT
jgi:hypothetical protein